jgi:hypothetical protein
MLDTISVGNTLPAPIARGISLTHRGDAVVSLIRLRRQLANLDAVDREYVGVLVADLAADLAIVPNATT